MKANDSQAEETAILTEMREHGGQYVARDDSGVAVAYAETEELLELCLQERGLQLQDVLVSRIPEYGVSYIMLFWEISN